MEGLKYSILVCAYANGWQFSNFLKTACNQDFKGDYEIIVIDNATPGNEIKEICSVYDSNLVKYYRLNDEQKKCKNITQGINYAAEMSQSGHLVIVADSNVLLSYNLLSEIDKDEVKHWRILISGKGTDIKISPNGKIEKEYEKQGANKMAITCSNILDEMGWPDDPMNLKLIDGKHRYPPPHNEYDVYVVSMSKVIYFEGSYNENNINWGNYHSNFVQYKCSRYGYNRLSNIRVIHQYHRVWKNDRAS